MGQSHGTCNTWPLQQLKERVHKLNDRCLDVNVALHNLRERIKTVDDSERERGEEEDEHCIIMFRLVSITKNMERVEKEWLMWRYFVRIEAIEISRVEGELVRRGRRLTMSQFEALEEFVQSTFVEKPFTPCVISAKADDLGIVSEAVPIGGESCIVCEDEVASRVLPCTHAFCGDCLKQWGSINPTCPLCRQPIPPEEEHFEDLAPPSSLEVESYLQNSLFDSH
eukprot:m.78070 g.78070  ORF g.78070 m.78070 type:complete len:225 (+) comp11940_c3_seq6:241-915(+)